MKDELNGTCVPPIYNDPVKIPVPDGLRSGVDIPHFASVGQPVSSFYSPPLSTPQIECAEKVFATQAQSRTPVVIIEQKIVPSTGTKPVCSTCGRTDAHTLILRRKAGYYELLCKQVDGSGCYPLASRRNCSYTYPNQIDCPQVAEYCVALGKERLFERQVCRDHVGESLAQGPLYLIYPLED